MKQKRYYLQSTFIFALALISSLCAISDNVQAHNLTDIQSLNSHIRAHIIYATEENFTKTRVYPKNARAYLLEHVAQALNKVQEDLEKEGLGLLVWDGYRPLQVQEIFWTICPDENYVADPKKGSKHNRGAAVDCTLIHLKTGKTLNMPTSFDDFSKKAWRSSGIGDGLTKEQIANRQKLEDAMHKRGFKGIPTEWWHFDWAEAAEHPERYPILQVTFEELQKDSKTA